MYPTYDKYGNPRGWEREVKNSPPLLRTHKCAYCDSPATQKVGGKWQCYKHLAERK